MIFILHVNKSLWFTLIFSFYLYHAYIIKKKCICVVFYHARIILKNLWKTLHDLKTNCFPKILWRKKICNVYISLIVVHIWRAKQIRVIDKKPMFSVKLIKKSINSCLLTKWKTTTIHCIFLFNFFKCLSLLL